MNQDAIREYQVLKGILKNSKEARQTIAKRYRKSERTIRRWIENVAKKQSDIDGNESTKCGQPLENP